MHHLTNSVLVDAAMRAIKEVIGAHTEWLLSSGIGTSQTLLKRSEFDFSATSRNLILSCWTERGTRTWRVKAWEWTSDKLRLEATRRMGAERALLELIPRASAKAITATVTAARQVRCEKMAQAALEMLPGSR